MADYIEIDWVEEDTAKIEPIEKSALYEWLQEVIELYYANGRDIKKVAELMPESEDEIRSFLDDPEYLKDRFGIDFQL